MQQAAPKEAMRFGVSLYRLLDCILEADPLLGTYFLSKVDLDNAYMRIWVGINGIPSVTFLITNKK